MSQIHVPGSTPTVPDGRSAIDGDQSASGCGPRCVTAHMETTGSLVHSTCWLRSGGQAKTSTGKDYLNSSLPIAGMSRGVYDMCDHRAKSPMDKKTGRGRKWLASHHLSSHASGDAHIQC